MVLPSYFYGGNTKLMLPGFPFHLDVQFWSSFEELLEGRFKELNELPSKCYTSTKENLRKQ